MISNEIDCTTSLCYKFRSLQSYSASASRSNWKGAPNRKKIIDMQLIAGEMFMVLIFHIWSVLKLPKLLQFDSTAIW